MPDLFKNIYNRPFFNSFIESIQEVVPSFNAQSFLNSIYDQEWDNRELKQRMRHITLVLQQHLSEDFASNTSIILQLIPILIKKGFKANNLEFTFLPDFIEVYGLAHFEQSVKAFEEITQFVSCEFAVRPFIIEYQEKMLQKMYLWSNHQHPMVRRLATEGCRPRLPWAMALPRLKQDPNPILPILENLKDDPSESVRRSVANNLNDISKDHPTTVIGLAKAWKGSSKEVDWLVKHASRTLLKQGNIEIMRLFGFGPADEINIDNFIVTTPSVKIGSALEFSFKLTNTSNLASKIRLEYGIYYKKANGSLSRKVFKISEKTYAEHSTTMVTRKQSFKIITTRKFHLGKHQVSIIINGVELNKLDFELTKR